MILRLCHTRKGMVIDTITLQIKGFEIDKKYLGRFQFLPSSKQSPDRYVFNQAKNSPDYTPNITIRMIKKIDGSYYTESIEIQFSAPKVFYGTNYFGISEKDFEKLTELLEEKLEQIFEGKVITKNLLRFADIKNLAFAYNFILSDYPDLISFLKLIPFSSVGKRYKKAKHTYYTEQDEFGFCGRLYNKQISFKLYGKGVETINNATTTQEFDVKRRIKNKELPFNVLRIEITFQHRTPLKKHLATLTDKNDKRERSFYEVFSNNLAQKILQKSFDEIMNELDITALDLPIYSMDECFGICQRAGFSQYDAYALMGRSLMVRQAGALQLKLTSDNYYDRRIRSETDKRLNKILELHPLPSFEFKKIIEECRKQLQEFKVMKPEDFDKQDLANLQ